jgi:hypothetical protein
MFQYVSKCTNNLCENKLYPNKLRKRMSNIAVAGEAKSQVDKAVPATSTGLQDKNSPFLVAQKHKMYF